MLSRDKRLNLKKEFSYVASGQKLEDSLVKIFYRFGQNPLPKVGIAISSANFKHAVDRNRARRVVSSVVEDLYQYMNQNLNLIILPKQLVLSSDHDTLSKQLKNLLESKNLLKI